MNSLLAFENNVKFSNLIEKSTNRNKKLMANVHGKLIHFGQAGASDYTIHHDDERKQRY